MESSERVLVIDDDKELCFLLSEYLRQEDFTVDYAHHGELGMEMALKERYSLVVLDVMLPGRLNGFGILQLIRAKSTVPVLMLSARGEDVDRIVGLEMGADDYLPKPFNPRELLARIRTILRRSKSDLRDVQAGGDTVSYSVGDIRLETGPRTVFCSETEVEVTGVEFKLLEVLLKNAGRVLTRDDLAAEVLGRSLSPYDRSIDVHISKLRKKLGPHPDSKTSGSERIKSVRGSGYLYTLPPASTSGRESRQQ